MRQILLVVHLIFYPFQGALFSMGKLHTLDFLTLEIWKFGNLSTFLGLNLQSLLWDVSLMFECHKRRDKGVM